jgi:hypothetical protein
MRLYEAENKRRRRLKPWKKEGRLRGQKKQVVAAVEGGGRIKVVVEVEVGPLQHNSPPKQRELLPLAPNSKRCLKRGI